MSFDFPSSPSIGQEYSSGSVVYVYNGTGWTLRGGGAAYVRFDAPQSLSATEQKQARDNIGASPFDAMMYGGLQVNGNMEIDQAQFRRVSGC